MKKIISSALVIIMTLVLISGSLTVSAEEYKYDAGNGKCVYVSDNGDDSADGSKDKPFKTLKKAFDALSDKTNTAEKSGGYIIIKDTLTVFDSENGKVSSANDSSRYALNFTGSKSTNLVTICGMDMNSKLVCANSYDTQDYKYYQGSFTFGSPAAFENIEISFSAGRVTIVSSGYIKIAETAYTNDASNDLYLNINGDADVLGLTYAHVFAPSTDDAEAHVTIGKGAIIGTFWGGIKQSTKDLYVTFLEGCQVNTFYIGGQSTMFNGNIYITYAGGKVGNSSLYTTAVIKGKTYVYYSGMPSTAPTVAIDYTGYYLDQSGEDGIAKELAADDFAGVLKVKYVSDPGAKIENGFPAKSFTISCMDKNQKAVDFPFDYYAIDLPDECGASDKYKVFAYDGSKYTECELASCGEEEIVFKPMEGAKLYTLVHMGSAAPAAEKNAQSEVGGVDVIENPLKPTSSVISGNEEGDDPTDDPAGNKSSVSVPTIIIIAAIVVIAAVCEILIISKNKKKTA